MKINLFFKVSILLWLFVFVFTYSKAQTIKVQSKSEKVSLPSAYFYYKFAGEEKGNTLITDKNGIGEIPRGENTQPVYVTLSYMGYETITDTLAPGENKTYSLRELSVQLKNVVITAQYEPGSAEKSVYKVKIIDSKDIEQRAATNLRDLLRQEMNIRLSQDNILGTGLTMQGVSGENVKILIDGVPVIGRTGGNIDISQINLSNVERIEIVEGPLSVNYGTNALGGAINVITKKTQYERMELGLNTYYESVGQYNADFKAGYKTGTNYFSVTGQRNYFDGWSQTDEKIEFPKEKPADLSRFQEWKPKEQYAGGLHYHKNLKTLQLHLSSNFFKEKITNKGLPKSPYFETAFDDYYYTNRLDNTANIYGTVGNGQNINFLVAYNDYKRVKNTYYKDLTTLEENLTANGLDQDTSLFKLINSRGTYSTSKDSVKVNYEIGYDLNLDRGYGLRLKNKQQEIGDYAVFASAEYTPVKKVTDEKFRVLTFRPGLRYAYNTSYKAPLSPSINVLYRPKDRISIRASYARGFRAPSLKELYFEFVDINHNIFGNPNLKAETSNNTQLSFSYSGSAGRRFWRIDPSVFYNNINNLITLSYIEAPNKNSYINVGKYNTYGGQVNTQFGEQELMFSVGGSLFWIHSELNPSAPVQEIFHGYSPEGTASVKYQIIKSKTQLAVFYKYTGKMLMYHYDENNNVEQSYMNDYQMFDFTISQPFMKKNIILAIGGKNLLNVRNVGMANSGHMGHGSAHGGNSISMPVNWGRTFFINLKINLNKRVK